MAPIIALPTMTQTPSPPRSEPSQTRLSHPDEPGERLPAPRPGGGPGLSAARREVSVGRGVKVGWAAPS
jgi:hypothetical protein